MSNMLAAYPYVNRSVPMYTPLKCTPWSVSSTWQLKSTNAMRTVVYTRPGISAFVIWMKETLRCKYALFDSHKDAA